MNFIPEKIQYNAQHDIFWVRVFYSASGSQAEAIVGTTTPYLHELFKQPLDVELGTSFMTKWLKIAMRDMARELEGVSVEGIFRKMYASNPADTQTGLDFLQTVS